MNNKKISPEKELDIKIEMPKYKLYTLSNGITVYLMPTREMPLTNLLFLYQHGSLNDPRDLYGLAHSTSSMLTKGTSSKSSLDIDFYSDHLGMIFNTYTYNQYLGVEAEVLNEYLMEAWDLVFDVLTNSTFPESELTKHKKRKIDAVKKMEEDPGQLVTNCLLQLMFNREYIGRATFGTPETISKIERKHIVEYYNNHFYPAAASLFMVGNFSEKDINKIETDLSLMQNEKSFNEHSIPEFDNSFKLWIVDKPDSTQVQVKIGWHTIPHNHPDFYPLLMGSIILGGGFSSRLMQEIRVKQGLSYGAYSQLQPINQKSSIFIINSFTRPKNITKLITSFQNEISKLHNAEVTQEELSTNRNYISGQYPLSFETNSDLLSKLTKLKTLGYKREQIENLPQFLKNTNPNQIQQALTQYIQWSNASISIVGAAKEIKKILPEELSKLAVVKSVDEIINMK